MAKEIAIQMTIDTSGAESNLVLVEDSLKDIEDSLKKIGAGGVGTLDDELAKLNDLTTKSKLNWGEMGKAIEQYQNIALAAGKESPIGQEAIRRAAEMKQEVDLLTQSVDAASKKGQALQASMQLASTVVAGYGAFQGVQALMGEESEKLKETFIKLQAAQTALVSIEQIRMAVSKESFLMLKLTDVWNKAVAFSTLLMAKAKGADAVATGTATVATKAFTAAMIATGIGALIVGIGLLVAYFDDVKKAMSGVTDFIYKMFKPQIDIVIATLKYFGLVESDAAKASRLASEQKATAARKAADEYIKALKAEEKALKESTDAKVKEIDFEIRKKQAAGKDYAKLEEDKINLIIETTKQQAELLNKQIQAEFEANLEIAKIRSKMGGLQATIAKVFLDEVEAAGGEKGALAMLLKSDEGLLELENTLTKAKQDLQIFSIEQDKIRRDQAAKNKKFGEEEFIKEYERRELNNIAFEEQAIRGTKKTNEELLKIYQEQQDKLAKQREADKQAELDAQLAKIDAVQEYANAAGSITSSLFEFTNNVGKKGEAAEEKRARRQFTIEKLLGITESAINTAKGIVKYTASGNLPMVGVMAATGAAQIAAIASQKFSPTGSGGSVSSATSSMTSGSVSDSGAGSGGTQTTNTDTLTNNNQPPAMQQVLVLDSLTKVQVKQNKIDALSNI